MQTQVKVAPRAPTQSEKDGKASNPLLDLENAFVVIDGKRHSVKDLLKLVVEKLEPHGADDKSR